MVERSPFPYHGPLTAEQVSGRDELIADLAERVVQRRLTALLGPRRYGKTSVLNAVVETLHHVGPTAVWVDLYALNSMADFAGSVDRGLAAVQGPARRALDAAAGSMSLQLGVLGVELSRGGRNRPDPVLELRARLQLLIEIAQRREVMLVLDEFSGIAGVDGAEGLLRTELQHHYQDLGIVFAGSQPSTMRALFADQAAPFFAQADLVEIGPLPLDEVVGIVVDGFERTGRDAGEFARRVARVSEGHPQRAMQLADALWRVTDEGSTADGGAWDAALASVRASVDVASERLFSMHPSGHQKLLRVVATGGSIYGTAANLVDLAPGTARSAVDALVGAGELVYGDDGLRLVDPLFADWCRRRFV